MEWSGRVGHRNKSRQLGEVDHQPPRASSSVGCLGVCAGSALIFVVENSRALPFLERCAAQLGPLGKAGKFRRRSQSTVEADLRIRRK